MKRLLAFLFVTIALGVSGCGTTSTTDFDNGNGQVNGGNHGDQGDIGNGGTGSTDDNPFVDTGDTTGGDDHGTTGETDNDNNNNGDNDNFDDHGDNGGNPTGDPQDGNDDNGGIIVDDNHGGNDNHGDNDDNGGIGDNNDHNGDDNHGNGGDNGNGGIDDNHGGNGDNGGIGDNNDHDGDNNGNDDGNGGVDNGNGDNGGIGDNNDHNGDDNNDHNGDNGGNGGTDDNHDGNGDNGGVDDNHGDNGDNGDNNGNDDSNGDVDNGNGDNGGVDDNNTANDDNTTTNDQNTTDDTNGTNNDFNEEDENYDSRYYIDKIPNDTEPVKDVAHAQDLPRRLPLLVILLEYNNQKIQSADSVWAKKIFGNKEGQLNHYYQTISYGQFGFTPVEETGGTNNDGIIKIKLNKNHLDTAINSSKFTSRLTKDIQSAIAAADKYVDFSKYDTNGNGALRSNEIAIIFVVAGYEDAYEGGHARNGIWAHQSSLSHYDAPEADGVKIFDNRYKGRYAAFGERHGDHDAVIGIIAHELGHAVFKLPDLYNVSGKDGGIGVFGLMGAGSWGRKNRNEYPGATPVHMCAWSKTYTGWVTPQVVSNTSATLTETASNEYNIIKIPISANHYYLLENRNNTGYDRGLYELDDGPNGERFQGGVLIWHINQKKLTTQHLLNNDVNADTHNKGVDVVEANHPVLDSQGGHGEATALFYNPNRTSFGPKVRAISAPGKVVNLNIH